MHKIETLEEFIPTFKIQKTNYSDYESDLERYLPTKSTDHHNEGSGQDKESKADVQTSCSSEYEDDNKEFWVEQNKSDAGSNHESDKDEHNAETQEAKIVASQIDVTKEVNTEIDADIDGIEANINLLQEQVIPAHASLKQIRANLAHAGLKRTAIWRDRKTNELIILGGGYNEKVDHRVLDLDSEALAKPNGNTNHKRRKIAENEKFESWNKARDISDNESNNSD